MTTYNVYPWATLLATLVWMVTYLQMKFNTDKCKVWATHFAEACFMIGKKLGQVIEEKDLRVMLSSNYKGSKKCI